MQFSNLCFPPEGLLLFFCSSSFVQFFWRSAAYMLSPTSLVWVNACMCFCLEWVGCICLKWLRHDQKSVMPLVYVQHVWISFCMYFIHLFAWIDRFLCENVAQWCVAWPVCTWCISKRLKPQDSPHVTYCSTDVSSECHETLLILCAQFSICYQSTMSLVILKTAKQGFCMCAP